MARFDEGKAQETGGGKGAARHQQADNIERQEQEVEGLKRGSGKTLCPDRQGTHQTEIDRPPAAEAVTERLEPAMGRNRVCRRSNARIDHAEAEEAEEKKRPNGRARLCGVFVVQQDPIPRFPHRCAWKPQSGKEALSR